MEPAGMNIFDDSEFDSNLEIYWDALEITEESALSILPPTATEIFPTSPTGVLNRKHKRDDEDRTNKITNPFFEDIDGQGGIKVMRYGSLGRIIANSQTASGHFDKKDLPPPPPPVVEMTNEVITEIRRGVVSKFLRYLNFGDMNALAKLVRESCCETCFLLFPDLEEPIMGKAEVMMLFSLIFEAFPDGVWTVGTLNIPQDGSNMISCNYRFTGTRVFDYPIDSLFKQIRAHSVNYQASECDLVTNVSEQCHTRAPLISTPAAAAAGIVHNNNNNSSHNKSFTALASDPARMRTASNDSSRDVISVRYSGTGTGGHSNQNTPRDSLGSPTFDLHHTGGFHSDSRTHHYLQQQQQQPHYVEVKGGVPSHIQYAPPDFSLSSSSSASAVAAAQYQQHSQPSHPHAMVVDDPMLQFGTTSGHPAATTTMTYNISTKTTSTTTSSMSRNSSHTTLEEISATFAASAGGGGGSGGGGGAVCEDNSDIAINIPRRPVSMREMGLDMAKIGRPDSHIDLHLLQMPRTLPPTPPGSRRSSGAADPHMHPPPPSQSHQQQQLSSSRRSGNTDQHPSHASHHQNALRGHKNSSQHHHSSSTAGSSSSSSRSSSSSNQHTSSGYNLALHSGNSTAKSSTPGSGGRPTVKDLPVSHAAILESNVLKNGPVNYRRKMEFVFDERNLIIRIVVTNL